jgi:hypothetical protein
MSDRLIKLTENFWNVRGSLKIAGLLDVGTQTSLARLSAGGWVLLDSYELSGTVREEILAATDGGREVKAIFHLHPFHTLHVRAVAAAFPEARLYGTSRHVTREPDLRWEELHTEDPRFAAMYSDDFEFSVPRGVDFIPDDTRLHFASVLAYHKSSRALHVDDTLTQAPPFPHFGGLSLHPSLGPALQKRRGAAPEFREWTEELMLLIEKTNYLCTAHLRKLPGNDGHADDLVDQVRDAIKKMDDTVRRHLERYG